MPYYVRPMRKEDGAQAGAIDREAFPTMWPPTNFSRELQNWLAHYHVACEGEPPSVPSPQPAAAPRKSLFGRLTGWFHHDGASPQPSPNAETVVGFLGFWLMADEAHITSIAVSAKWQGKGIGELLLLTGVEHAAKLNASIATLEVRASNKVAQNLYRKYGFAEVGLRKGYYTDNREDALIMTTAPLSSPAYQQLLSQIKDAYARKWGVNPSRVIAV